MQQSLDGCHNTGTSRMKNFKCHMLQGSRRTAARGIALNSYRFWRESLLTCGPWVGHIDNWLKFVSFLKTLMTCTIPSINQGCTFLILIHVRALATKSSSGVSLVMPPLYYELES